MNKIRAVIDAYHPLSENSYEEFTKIISKKNYKKKTVLLKAKRNINKFYILMEGIARSKMIDSNGDTRTRSILQTPVIFTSIKPIKSNNNNTYSYVTEFDCLTDVTVYEGDFLDFKRLTIKHHDISIFYNSILEKAIDIVLEKSTILSMLDATGRYLYLKNKIPNIESLIQLNHIASYLNITSIQLSRIRKRLCFNKKN